MQYFQTIQLKNGKTCVLRNGTAQDGQAALDVFVLTHKQTDNLLTYPDEITFTAEEEAEHLQKLADSANEIEILAEIDGKIVGTAGIEQKSPKFKLRHRCEFGISIDEAYWGLGIGRALTAACIECAVKAGYEQIELEVVAESAPENVVPYVQLGFNAPASGTEVTFDHESYKIKATPAADTFITLPGNVDYTYSGYWSALWCDSTGEDTVQDDFTVYGGMTYYIEVLLKATNGKHFDLRYTAVAVDNASVLSTELESGMLYMVFAFTPGKGEGDLSVRFDPNGGAGELPTIYLPAGRSCQLPACSFTKAERIFAAWEVNGEKKNPNDTITVTADTVVKAIWRHTKIVDVVNTVDTSTTEVVGTLVLTDSRTGEETSIEVSRGTAASGFSNPQSDDVNALIETAKDAIRTEAAKYGITADTDSLEPDVSVVDTTDKRTLEFESDMTDENGDLYAAFIIKGDFGHVWRMTFTLTVEKTASSVLIGDVNNDGNINIFDVTAIQRHLAEMELLSGGGLKAADCTGDGKVSIDDATRLQMYLAEYDVTLG